MTNKNHSAFLLLKLNNRKQQSDKNKQKYEVKRQRGNELFYAETCAKIFFDMEKAVGECVL